MNGQVLPPDDEFHRYAASEEARREFARHDRELATLSVKAAFLEASIKETGEEVWKSHTALKDGIREQIKGVRHDFQQDMLRVGADVAGIRRDLRWGVLAVLGMVIAGVVNMWLNYTTTQQFRAATEMHNVNGKSQP